VFQISSETKYQSMEWRKAHYIRKYNLKWIILSRHKGGKIITKAHKVFLAEYEIRILLIGTFNKQGMIQKEFVPIRKTMNI